MSIAINSRKVVQLPPDEYAAVAQGILYALPNDLKLNANDDILIKEHDGKHYTGNEIIGRVTESSTQEFRFKKYAVVSNGAEGSQNKRDSRRGNVKSNKFNAYI